MAREKAERFTRAAAEKAAAEAAAALGLLEAVVMELVTTMSEEAVSQEAVAAQLLEAVLTKLVAGVAAEMAGLEAARRAAVKSAAQKAMSAELLEAVLAAEMAAVAAEATKDAIRLVAEAAVQRAMEEDQARRELRVLTVYALRDYFRRSGKSVSTHFEEMNVETSSGLTKAEVSMASPRRSLPRLASPYFASPRFIASPRLASPRLASLLLSLLVRCSSLLPLNPPYPPPSIQIHSDTGPVLSRPILLLALLTSVLTPVIVRGVLTPVIVRGCESSFARQLRRWALRAPQSRASMPRLRLWIWTNPVR